MTNLQRLLKKMWRNIETQKQNIDQFYKCQQATTTDIYRTKYYAEMLEKNLDRLKSYLEENAHINPKNKEEYARNLNNIAIQTNIIKVTQQAMNDQIYHLKRAEDIQTRLCGNLIHLKKDIDRILDKAEKLL